MEAKLAEEQRDREDLEAVRMVQSFTRLSLTSCAESPQVATGSLEVSFSHHQSVLSDVVAELQKNRQEASLPILSPARCD